MGVLIMLALRVEPAATDWKFRLSGILMAGRPCGASLSAREFAIQLPLVGKIRLSFQHAKLLLMRFTALQSRTGAARAIFPGWLPAIVYFRLVDPTLWV